MAESFDAVLAEMRKWADRYESNGSAALATNLREYASRLQSAHAAEVAKLRGSAASIERECLEAWKQAGHWRKRADLAVGLLRDYRMAPKFSHDHAAIKRTVELEDEIDAFLSEQAGERENGE